MLFEQERKKGKIGKEKKRKRGGHVS